MAKKNRRDPNDEQFLILRKLASNRQLRRGDFEQPKPTIKGIKDELELGRNKSKYIPHSSLILRLNELIKSQSIIELDSGEKSKKGLVIKEYYLTFFGFIKLLQLCEKEKFYEDIFLNASKHIPKIIWFQIEKLIEIEMVSKEHLFFILIEIAKNTDLQIDFTPRDNAGIIGNRVYRFPSSLLDKKIKWIHVYDIEIKIKQIENTYPLRRTFITSGKTKSQKDMKEKDSKFMGEINRMFVFAFVNELIMRCYRINDRFSKTDEDSKYITPDEAPFLLEVLKLDESLKRIYFEHIDYVLDQQRIEQETMINVKKSLKSKRSLISKKNLK